MPPVRPLLGMSQHTHFGPPQPATAFFAAFAPGVEALLLSNAQEFFKSRNACPQSACRCRAWGLKREDPAQLGSVLLPLRRRLLSARSVVQMVFNSSWPPLQAAQSAALVTLCNCADRNRYNFYQLALNTGDAEH